ncbi:hypothetical protein N7456_008122 [Penicillium angulare]|uniref:Ubiquitin-like domain-containing protein n=1 Tax=Penicillium angulare TaxID=116970 RepID=A0A9W9FBX4_9EURO|nr:hypothetical protein N7456_008122 [Penicillium angulare]
MSQTSTTTLSHGANEPSQYFTTTSQTVVSSTLRVSTPRSASRDPSFDRMTEKAPTPKMSEGEQAAAPVEHLNIKVTDNNNEVFFKIKRSTPLKKLMDAFCERQGKQQATVRFLFDGTRVRPDDTPDTLDMADGDTLEVHQEQIGG